MITVIIPSVQDLIGIPFEAGGRGPVTYDCWGLVREVRRRFGLETPEYIYQNTDVEDPAIINNVMVPATQDVRWHTAGPNDVGGVVAIRNAGGPFVNHCGVLIAPYMFMHTLKGVGAHVVRFDSPMYRHRIFGVYEWTKS
jgi:cell wall-associated NlpC family hydrolase